MTHGTLEKFLNSQSKRNGTSAGVPCAYDSDGARLVPWPILVIQVGPRAIVVELIRHDVLLSSDLSLQEEKIMVKLALKWVWEYNVSKYDVVTKRKTS